jgi:hypothetical protein
MAKFVKHTSDLAEALNSLQITAERLFSTQTARTAQLAREKEEREIDAYKYLIGLERNDMAEHEAAIDSVKTSLLERGVELEDLPDLYKGLDAQPLLASASKGALDMLQTAYEDTQNRKLSLEKQRRNATQALRHVNLWEESLANIDPGYVGNKTLVEAGDVSAAISELIGDQEKFQKELDDYAAFRQTPGQLAISNQDWLQKKRQEIEAQQLTTGAEHVANIGAIESYEIPRQELSQTLQMRSSDIAMTLSRRFAPMGALKKQIEDEDDTNKKEALVDQLQAQYADLGSLLYPQLMNSEGVWQEPAKETQARLAEDLSTSLLLLQEGRATEFVNYLEHVQSYYDEMKKDQTETGLEVSSRIRSEVLTLLGVDLEVPISFGGEVMSEIDIILAHYKEIERIDLEQSFHGLQISKSIAPNVLLDTSYPELEESTYNRFMKSKKAE